MKPDFNEEQLFVMSEETWEIIKEYEYEFANTQPNPIKYLKSLSQLNIIFDNTVPLGLTELWTKEQYSKYLKEKNDN